MKNLSNHFLICHTSSGRFYDCRHDGILITICPRSKCSLPQCVVLSSIRPAGSDLPVLVIDIILTLGDYSWYFFTYWERRFEKGCAAPSHQEYQARDFRVLKNSLFYNAFRHSARHSPMCQSGAVLSPVFLLRGCTHVIMIGSRCLYNGCYSYIDTRRRLM